MLYEVITETDSDLYRMLDDLKDMLGIRAEKKGISLTVRYDAGIPRYIRTDEAKLRQQNPEQTEQLYGIEADLLARGGELASATQVLDEALVQLPDSSSLRYARAMIAEQQGDLALMESRITSYNVCYTKLLRMSVNMTDSSRFCPPNFAPSPV